MAAHVLHGLAVDPGWSFHRALDHTGVKLLGHVRAQLGLPWFLKATFKKVAKSTVPVIFPFVKSKCHAASGEQTCQQPGHSCCRRILDTCGSPLVRSWQVLGRGVRGVVQSLGGHEVFAAREAGPRLRQVVDCLEPPCLDASGVPRCRRCNKETLGHLNIYSCDIDQAFESCLGTNIPGCWERVSGAYQSRHGSKHILVKRGRSFMARIGTRGWSRGWWAIHLEHLGRGLLAAASATVACLGDLTVEMEGMSIGGSMSGAAVAVRLAAEELEATSTRMRSLGFQVSSGSLGWLRYVDDVLACSYQYCSSCQEVFFKNLYSEPVSTVFSSDSSSSSCVVWLVLEIHIFSSVIVWALKTTTGRGSMAEGSARSSNIYRGWGPCPYRLNNCVGPSLGNWQRVGTLN